jgi:hypothetical protein
MSFGRLVTESFDEFSFNFCSVVGQSIIISVRNEKKKKI